MESDDGSGAFNKSTRTEHSPPTPKVSVQKVPADNSRWTKEAVSCCKCDKIDTHTKILCQTCKLRVHLKCAPFASTPTVTAGKWNCWNCAQAIEIPDDTQTAPILEQDAAGLLKSAIKNASKEKQNSNMENIVKSAKLSSIINEQIVKLAPTSNEASLPENSDVFGRVGSNSTQKKPTSTGSRRSRSSNSQSQKAALLEAEQKFAELRAQRRAEEEAVDRRRLQRLRETENDQLLLLEMKRQFLNTRPDSGDENSSVSSSCKMSNTSLWLHQTQADQKRVESTNSPKDNTNTRQYADNQQRLAKARPNQTLSWLHPTTSEREFLEQSMVGTLTMRHLTKEHKLARQVLKQDLPIFSGDPLQWAYFMSTYVNTTKQCGYTDQENTIRLSKCLKGPALEAVGGDLMMAETLPSALTTLRMFYGRPDTIFNAAMARIRACPPVRLEKLDTIVTFSTRIKSMCDTMRTAGMSHYLEGPPLLAEIQEMLPPALKIEWGRHRQTMEWKERVTVETLNSWLRGYATTVCAVSSQPMSTFSSDIARKGKQEVFHAIHDNESVSDGKSRAFKADVKSVKCPICKVFIHPVRDCKKFEAMSVPKRWRKIRSKRLCVSCLGHHWLRDCTKRQICGLNGCTHPHNRLLHAEKTQPQSQEKMNSNMPSTNPATISNLPSTSNTSKISTSAQANAANVMMHNSMGRRVYCQIVPITLHGADGNIMNSYAFLDGGSFVTLMEDSLAVELGLQGIPDPLVLKWTNDVCREEATSCRVSVKISGYHQSDMYEVFNVRTTGELSLPQQSLDYNHLKSLKHLRSLPIQTYTDARPRMLIGLDNYQLMVGLETREGAWQDPVGIRTRLGWTLLGGAQPSAAHLLAVNHHYSIDNQLHDLVKSFFAFESLGIKIPKNDVESHEDARAKMLLKSTVKKISSGERYEAGLLWKADDVKLPESRTMALHRLRCFENKLERNQNLKRLVHKEMEEYIKLGYLTKLTPEEARIQTARTWYLPIFSVSNPNKANKTRLVWDAAATVNGTSLNTHLLSGPDLLQSLVGVLLKFREHPYAISGDIKKMFHQVQIRRDDQDSQRCLYRKSRKDEPDTYRMTVMTFGASCSPSIAQYVKNMNADRFGSDHPRAVEAIKHRHYVDDFIDSYETAEECINVTRQVIAIHKSGGFHIRNFMANSPLVKEALVASTGEKLLADPEADTKVLGMLWHSEDDTLRFRVNHERMGVEIMGGHEIPTKRIVLRILMMIFDPLGLLGFYIIHGKLILKEVWRVGTDWDDKIKPKQREMWKQWMSMLHIIESIKLPRCYSIHSESMRYELHTFVDASENAAAAVVYILIFSDGRQQTAFVSSKTKIAPNKYVSIPRMELQAAVIGARLANTIREKQSIIFDKLTFWSDSRNVLCWLRSPKRFKQFVACRVGEILESTNTQDWRWVPSKLNIADQATKWKMTDIPKIPERWFDGPEFLQHPSAEWPQENKNVPNPPNDEELIDEISCLAIGVAQKHEDDLAPDIERFSSYNRLIRVQAIVLRFFNYSRATAPRRANQLKHLISSEHKTGRVVLTPEEIDAGRIYFIRRVQQETFATELQILRGKKILPKTNKLKSYSPFIDKYSILRMNSRLINADYLTYDQRYPIILPLKHRFTEMLLAGVHARYHHRNHATVMNEIMQQYAIPQLRRQLKTVRAKCARCKINNARPEYPEMAALPRSRLAAGMRPFTYTGVDYFGPIAVKVGRRLDKKWGSIFTCLTTRAVHIELVSSLSSDAFMLALRAFISRRGMPLEIFSDNGTNFKGADAEMQGIVKDNIAQDVRSQFSEIKWTFNPPAAPHMGGAWERLIRTIKIGLKAAISVRAPSEDLLRSSLAEIESMINSRPLTYVETNGDSLEALTPNHFLLGSSGGVKPCKNFTDDVHILRLEWKRQQRISQVFWNRWIAEYLPSISRRTCWFDTVEPLRKGDVVGVVKSDTPYSWDLGRVVETVQSKDGSVRQVIVRTASGLLKRPVCKLAVLLRESDELNLPSDNSTGGSIANGSWCS